MTGYRPEYEAALRLFAKVSKAMEAKGLRSPVLVGGAAVELYSGSAVTTGDFDIVTPRQAEFEALLQEHGFIRPSGPGMATRGWIHPELGLGFEVVGSTVLDGNSDADRLQLIDAGEDGVAQVISVEDIIADRMGQFASGTAPEMREQAQKLFALYPDADKVYMEKRIRQETDGTYGVENLEE
ncbi:MAG: hypothetical protein GW808_03330 [Sphingomonadales bacterium]|nr:hypothetical protein [Sphingomonadales bacterium]NCO49937.1 hypothetical protein [Sphingomonadales bacterium]NCP00910.1 hypothetical protein [Sphingomonadales bacterium]NCP28032.1 hypothetical protein [Sphingomonadales bacterium]NCP42964.1 hypothetical protein [Sphingomonadales bacterium]